MTRFRLVLHLYRRHCAANSVTVPFHHLGEDGRRPWLQLARQTYHHSRRRYGAFPSP